MEDDSFQQAPAGDGGTAALPRHGRRERMPPGVRRITLGAIVVWLVLVAGLGWWMAQRAVTAHLDSLAASAGDEAQATARIVDRLFAEMTSVANMVASQAQVIELATRYRNDPPGAADWPREQRAAWFTREPLARKVGDFMNALSSDLHYARIYMNNLADDTVIASNWAEPGSIVGMIYTGRPYLIDALRAGNGHSFGIARLNKTPSYFVASRIEDAANQPLGSVTVKFDASDMAMYLTGRHVAVIANRQGRVTTASSPAFMLRNVAALMPPELIRSSDDDEGPGDPIGIHALAGANQWLIDGKPYLVLRRPLLNTQYQLFTLVALDDLAPLRRRYALAAMLVSLFGVALILFAGHAAGQMVMRRRAERQAAMRTAELNRNLSVALTDAKTKERQKVEVLGYIGHDLRAPLTTIDGYSQLLLANASDAQHELLSTIQRSVKYQLDLIDELMGYAKAELQPLAIQPVPTDLVVLLDGICEHAIALCAQRNDHFRYRCATGLPQRVDLDGKRLQQVLLNLISNAAKFTRDGVVMLTVSARPEGGACVLQFAVSDTGIGIDLSQGVDIFGAFQQIQSVSGGTGLGLFIAQHIVTAMGGTLSVDSVAGQGTTFSFALSVPAVDASDAAWVAVAPRDVAPSPAKQGAPLALDAFPAPQALDELAELALHGRITDIERWIGDHTDPAAHAPFLALLHELLARFDFAGIRALALQGRGGGQPPEPAAMPV